MIIFNLQELPNKNRNFIFDANFLIDLYSIYKPYRNYSVENISNFLVNNKCLVYITPLVLSEFINIFIKKELGHKFSKKADPKNGIICDRNTENYNNCLKKLKIKLEAIQNFYNIKFVDSIDLFAKLENTDYIKEFNEMEFSDWSIKQIAKETNSIIITNDKDFKSSAKNNEIDIIIT